MARTSSWDLADVFTLIQAAYLWHDREPPRISVDEVLHGGRPPEVAAVAQALLGAAQKGELPVAGLSANFSSQDLFRVTARREDLAAYAVSKKQKPAFLFDTILPQADVADASASGKNRGGRPATYDWDGCVTEIIRIADIDGLPAVQSDLIGQLQQWFINSIDNAPAESEIKRRVSPIYKRLRDGGWKPRTE